MVNNRKIEKHQGLFAQPIQLLRKVIRKMWPPAEHEQDPSNGRLLIIPLSVLEMWILLAFPAPRSCPKWTQPWESDVMLRPPGLCGRLSPVKASTWTSKLWQMGAEIYSSCSHQDRPHKFPCLLNLLPTNLGWTTSFAISPCPLTCIGVAGVQLYLRRSEELANQPQLSKPQLSTQPWPGYFKRFLQTWPLTTPLEK